MHCAYITDFTLKISVLAMHVCVVWCGILVDIWWWETCLPCTIQERVTCTVELNLWNADTSFSRLFAQAQIAFPHIAVNGNGICATPNKMDTCHSRKWSKIYANTLIPNNSEGELPISDTDISLCGSSDIPELRTRQWVWFGSLDPTLTPTQTRDAGHLASIPKHQLKCSLSPVISVVTSDLCCFLVVCSCNVVHYTLCTTLQLQIGYYAVVPVLQRVGKTVL